MSSVSTVKISNVSLSASEQDIKEFFSFSGEIVYVGMERGDESSQVAYVAYKEEDGAETALLLTGAKIMDLVIDITAAPDYQLPADVSVPPAPNGDGEAVGGIGTAVQKAEGVVTTMLAKGFILGKDAVSKAKAFDEKHQLTSTASAKVSDFEKRIGLRDKISMGTAAVNEKVTEMDQKFQVSEKTRSAIASAEQKVSTAGAAIMGNRYVFTSAAWVSGAFNRVTKAAADVGSRVMDKAAGEYEATAATEEETRNDSEVELKVLDKAVTEQEAGTGKEVELNAGDKAVAEQEAGGPGNEVELNAGDKAVAEQEARAGDDVESKTVDKSVTKEEQHKVEDELSKVDVSEPSKDSSTEHQGKPEPA